MFMKSPVCTNFYWWRFTDSNRGPVDYDEKVYKKIYINQRYFFGVYQGV
jgi:hypothetical protein